MNAGEHADPKSPSIIKTILSLIVMLALALGLSWLLREYVVQPYEIPSGSMETTIMTDDKLFSEKISYYTGDIKTGDIVTFEDMEIPGRILIKRCIATAGQTIDLEDGVVYVDGVPLNEPYTNGQRSDPLGTTLTEISYPYTIPTGHIWVMGDNRTNSKDSRYFGAVAESTVTGRAWLIYWPFNRFGLLS